MEFSISGHHYHVSDATSAYVEERAMKLERFYTPILDCSVTLRKENRTDRVDVVVNVHAQTLKSSGDTGNSKENLYVAVDQAMDKMERQLRKLHDKRRGHRPDARSVPAVPDDEE